MVLYHNITCQTHTLVHTPQGGGVPWEDGLRVVAGWEGEGQIDF